MFFHEQISQRMFKLMSTSKGRDRQSQERFDMSAISTTASNQQAICFSRIWETEKSKWYGVVFFPNL